MMGQKGSGKYVLKLNLIVFMLTFFIVGPTPHNPLKHAYYASLTNIKVSLKNA